MDIYYWVGVKFSWGDCGMRPAGVKNTGPIIGWQRDPLNLYNNMSFLWRRHLAYYTQPCGGSDVIETLIDPLVRIRKEIWYSFFVFLLQPRFSSAGVIFKAQG